MSISCEIIRDLLPLYHDGVCSGESRALVTEHLENCDSCRGELELMDAELRAPHPEPDEKKAMEAVSAAWKSTKKRSFLRGTAIAVLCCALLVGGYIGLTQWKIIPVPADVLEVTDLSRLPDGTIAFRLFVNDDKSLHYTKYTTTDDGRFYVTPMRSVIESARRYGIGGFDQYHALRPSGEGTEPVYIGLGLREDVTEIHVGPVGDGVLIWERGMELPEATEELCLRLQS